MKAAVRAQLIANLKVLKLSAMLSHLEAQLCRFSKWMD